MIAPRFMLGARCLALWHIRFGFARKGCRIWRIYSYLGWRTHGIICECGAEFGTSEPRYLAHIAEGKCRIKGRKKPKPTMA